MKPDNLPPIPPEHQATAGMIQKLRQYTQILYTSIAVLVATIALAFMYAFWVDQATRNNPDPSAVAAQGIPFIFLGGIAFPAFIVLLVMSLACLFQGLQLMRRVVSGPFMSYKTFVARSTAIGGIVFLLLIVRISFYLSNSINR